MKDVFVSPPFRVVPVGQTMSDDAAYLMVMSSSPGILDGDHYDLMVQVEENAQLQLQSQSYQRLFTMVGGASQLMRVALADHSAFSYVPHPIVPHTDSTFKGITRVEMGEDCSLLMSEIITCGRKHHGEVFRFTHFQNLIEVRHRNRLILKDNVLLQPDLMQLGSLGQLEGYTHQGTLIYINTQKQPVEELIEHFYEMLDAEKDMQCGISRIQHDGFVVRCLGNGGEQIYNCFQRIQNFIWEEQHILAS
ncbi:urease accessory protein [Dyadobacter soli]|uniref:Urease accessory protein UreD n=2 Tax=Dyadobacter soli TaxID=659014 RepID=A0A1G7Q380_9BACT|nr:urease accessory protein [Dyadobacter soli]